MCRLGVGARTVRAATHEPHRSGRPVQIATQPMRTGGLRGADSCRCTQERHLAAGELASQKRPVEPKMVRHQHGADQKAVNLTRHVAKARRSTALL